MVYKDSKRTISERVEDLLERMTLKEKVAQLYCSVVVSGEDNIDNQQENIKEGIGTISYLNSSLTGDNKKDMDTLKKIQRFLMEETRLGIPALIHNEGISGAQIPEATTFPQSINVASTWEPELAQKMGEVIRKQLLAYGIRAVHSPLFDLGRDPRWGRIGETYGEDPYLVARMGTSFVKGIQGDNQIMATAKHFVGYGNSEGGRNGGEQQIAERKLLDSYCFPFEAAIHEANVMAIMNSYGILNDQAVSTSKWLLTDILRDKLGFDGLVVADYGSIDHAHELYRVVKDKKEAAIRALEAGLDVEQPDNKCFQFLVEAVEAGEIAESYIDRSVRRVLTTKFKLGIFENPYEDGDYNEETSKSENNELSQEIAEKSIVMVKNEENILPLRKNIKIAVIGPNADTKTNFFGGYSSVGSASTVISDFDKSEESNFVKIAYAHAITDYKESLKAYGIEFEDQPSPEQKAIILQMIKQNYSTTNKEYKTAEEFVEKYYPNCKSVKEVLEEKYGTENVIYSKGCNITSPMEGGMEEVRNAILQADLVIAVLGGKESMIASEATCGENNDNANIGLEKPQIEMMKEAFQLNKPVISVIVDARPLATPHISEKSKAVLYSWVPAQAGAHAIVNILTGECNPSGKLPVTIAREVSQLPMYYNRVASSMEMNQWAGYIGDDINTPLYPFGHGLSYTQFEYSNLNMDTIVPADGKIKLNFMIKNVGQCRGDEIAQVYIRDCVGSVARPVKQLIGFVRVSLNADETREVSFEIDLKQLAFHDLNMDQVIEPGEMELLIGASSQDIRIKQGFEIIGEKLLVDRKVFSSKVTVGGQADL